MNRIIGHRGAAGYAPENTIASFEMAKSLGCDFIEFDVMLSADGYPFIFHDESLKRTTNGRGEFGLSERDYLLSLDAGKWFSRKFQNEKIPSLQTALEWLLVSNIKANIEIKPYPGMSEQTTLAVLSHLNRYWPEEKPLPLVSSFDWSALAVCHDLSPELPLGLLMDKWTDQWREEAKKLNCYSIHMSTKAATQSRVEAIKAEGYAVFVYTVNRRLLARKLLRWGVDALFSDYPDLLGSSDE